MPSGGARNRSGPQADPTSGRSDRRGLSLTALPNEGYRGSVPEFPLPQVHRFNEFYEDGKKRRETDGGATADFRDRELAIWETMWRTPQACAWARESWRWETVGEFCRLKAVVELEPDANAALVGQMHRYRDQIGLTPAGLKENGWTIAAAQIEPAADEKPAAKAKSSRDRMKVVKGDGA